MRRPASSTKQSDGSCRTGRYTPAWPGYASRASVGHSRKHGHIVPPGTFFAVFVRGQKRYRILPSERPVWRAFQNVTQAWPQTILFGQAGFIILRGGGRRQPRQCLAVIPRHPLRWASLQLLGMPLQRREVVERIGSIQFAGVDQTHEQIADSGAVRRLVKERILPVQNGFLKRTLDDVVVDWRARLSEEKRQFRLVIQ